MAASPEPLLAIYLQDPLARASAGVELARRAARNNAGTELGAAFARLSAEIEEDRQTLRRILGLLGFRASRAKEALAVAGERVGRLKLNGRIREYSPLSRVLELEALSTGIAGKLALWRSLQAVALQSLAGVDLAQLADRAERQRSDVEELRLAAVRLAFPGR